MLALYLLASHFVGDFIFQTRWQAAGKFGWTDEAIALRARHVGGYTLAFVPVTVAYGGWGSGFVFVYLLALLHFLTDSRRTVSTLGDVIAWYFGGAGPPAEKRGVHVAMGADPRDLDLPPNPWAPLPIFIDQTLHIVQLAALGWLLT